MKKYLVLSVLLACCFVSRAYDFSAVAPTGQTLCYDIISSSSSYTVAVTSPNGASFWSGYTAPTGDLTIPSSVSYRGITYSVTSIGIQAFYNCSGLTSVTIPNSVTSIGMGAFEYCSGLTSVTIPNSVASIEYYTFEYCSGLTSVTIPNSVTSIGDASFAYCSGLTSVVIPNSVTSIGSSAFYGCSGLTSVTIPNSVTSIGVSAFCNCSGLTSVTFNATNCITMGNAGHPVFSDCTNLNSLTIGEQVTTIPSYAFYDCSHLTGEIILNSVTSIGESAFYNCSGLTSVIIPNSVTSIGGSAFYDCRGLTSLIIPNSVTSIGESTFYNCRSLTSVTIPNSVTSIGGSAFCNCSGLTSVTIPNSVTSIGGQAFWNCSGLTSVTIPNSVTSIGTQAFSDCNSLTIVTVPNSVTSIGGRAFDRVNVVNYCGSATGSPWGAYHSVCGFYEEGDFIYQDSTKTTLVSYVGSDSIVTIPNSVTSVGGSAFYNCSGLTSVTIPNSVTSIGESAFYNCSGLTSVTIPNSVTSIGESAFYNCSGLTSVIIPNSVTSIGGSVFRNCSGLTSATIGNSVTSIGQSAFANCSNLTSVTIPDSVTSIGSEAFRSCSNLASVTIGKSVTNIGACAFENCNGLTSMNYTGTIEGWCGITFSSYAANPLYFTHNLYICGILQTNIIIPNSVTSIGSFAFISCSGLTSVTIPNSVTSIGLEAFCDCSGLTSVTIPNSVTSIGESAFHKCSSLTSVIIPNSVTSIGKSTFNNCSSLTSVTIGNSVTSIGNYAFYSCDDLTGVTIPNSVTSIGNSAFDNCSGLTSVTIPNSVTSIGDYAFRSCSGLTSVTIGNSITSIAARAFQNCRGLHTVYLLNPTAPTLGLSCFIGCPIQEIHIPCGSMDSYSSRWSSYRNYLQEPTVTFERVLQSSNDTMGGVSLVSLVCSDTSIISAIPNYGYHFTQWSDGVSDNPRTFVLTQDTTFTAEFGYNSYAIVKSCDTIQGNVMGVDSAVYLSHVVLTAESHYGYHFTQWSDGVTTNPRTFVLTQDTTFIAQFGYNSYAVTKSCDAIQGNVIGVDSADYLSNVVLTAEPHYGYHFTQWSDGDTDNPRTFVLTQDTSFTAEFAINQYAIVGVCASDSMGSVSGSDTVDYLQTVTLAATANYGYHFTQWNDGITDNPRMIVADSNKTFTAQFGYNSYAVAKSCDAIQGNVIGVDSADYLSNVVLTAEPHYGYHFTQWSDGVTDNPRTFVLTQDTSFTAEFAINQYAIVGVCASDSMGSVSGSDTVDYLQTVTLAATANYGYHFTQWNDGNTDNPRMIVADSNKTFTAQFSYNSYAVTKSCDAIQGNVIGVDSADYLSNVVLTAEPHYGYHFTQWSDGVTDNPRTFVLTQDTLFTAQFGYNSYAIVKSCDTIQGNVIGVDSSDYLSNVVLTAVPNYGYHFTQWSDGVTVNPRSFVLSQDTAFVAEFDRNSYAVTCVSNDVSMGQVQGGGTFLYLDTVVLSAEPVEPYGFFHWQDGDTVNPRNIVVYSDSTFTAYFVDNTEGIETVQKSYTLTVVGNAIRISGAMGETVRVFDVVGRQLLKKKLDSEEIRLNQTGVFFVQIGNAPAEKVVLVR